MRKYFYLLCFILIANTATAEDNFLSLDKIIVYKTEPYSFGEIRVLTDSQIKDLPIRSVPEAFKYLGIDLQSRGAQGVQSDFSLRGSTFQQVLILLNGMRINDSQTAHHNSDLPVNLEDIERIEVYPGNLNTSFGLDNFAGSINIVTKKPKENKSNLVVGGGQDGTSMESFSYENKKGNLANQVSIANKETNGFQYDTDARMVTVSSHHFYDLDCGSVKLDLGYDEKEFGAYDFYTPGKGYPSKEWTKTEFIGLNAELNKDKFVFIPKLYWRRHYDKFMLDITRPALSLNHHRTDTLTQQFSTFFPTEFFGKFLLGEEIGEEKINSTNLGKYARQHYSIYLQNEKRFFDNLTLSLGNRYDHFDDFNSSFSPLFLLTYKISDSQLHLSASQAIRIPSFTELYYNDPTTEGDRDLSAEESINYETGLLHNFKNNNQLGLNLFARQEKDLIEWAKTSPSDTKWKVRNIGQAQVLGLDFYGKMNLIKPDISFKYTYINRQINEEGGYLPKYGPISLKHSLNVAFDFNFLSSQQRIDFFFKKRPARRGWLLNDLRLSKNVVKDIELFLDINNLLNVEYEEVVGIPQPGRWIQAGFKLQW